MLIELHYLSLDLHGFDIDLQRALALLDPDEAARYHRFKNSHAQNCYLQARRMVKTLLAKKLDCDPAQVLFAYSETEKPYLPNQQAWHFNISHSHSTICVAISQQLVGVDVEDIARCEKIWQKAEEFLNPYVKHCVEKASNAGEAAAIFATHWSCTESYIKLKGSAIYREKDRVEARFLAAFEHGSRFQFEDCQFTVFECFPEARISVANFSPKADIELMFWRTGEHRYY